MDFSNMPVDVLKIIQQYRNEMTRVNKFSVFNDMWRNHYWSFFGYQTTVRYRIKLLELKEIKNKYYKSCRHLMLHELELYFAAKKH